MLTGPLKVKLKVQGEINCPVCCDNIFVTQDIFVVDGLSKLQLGWPALQELSTFNTMDMLMQTT